MFLYQPGSGYCYNSDSIFLFKFISKYKPVGRLLDVGCGVGILSLLLGRDFDMSVCAVEKQQIMCEYAKRNFELNKIDAKVVCKDFLEYEFDNRYDWIVSNPPFYAPTVLQSEDSIKNIARYSHHLPLELFIAKCRKVIKPKGYFALCYDAKQVDRVLATLRDRDFAPEFIRFIHPKSNREAKIVLILARAGSKAVCKVLPPWIIFGDNGEYLKEAKEAFIDANTHSIKGDL